MPELRRELLFNGCIFFREAYHEQPNIRISDPLKGFDEVVHVLPCLEAARVGKSELRRVGKRKLTKQIQIDTIAHNPHSIWRQTFAYKFLGVRITLCDNIIRACYGHSADNSHS